MGTKSFHLGGQSTWPLQAHDGNHLADLRSHPNLV